MTTKTVGFNSISTNEELADYCGVSWGDLRVLAYAKRVKLYSEWLVPKRNGSGYRRISSPMANLRRVQQSIAQGLSEFYCPPKCVYGFIQGRSVAMNALQHVGKRAVLTLDIEDFFPSITSARVHGLFSKVLQFPPDVTNTLTNLVCYKGSLPQGAPTSPVISNIICYKLDSTFLMFAARNKMTYSRYADDLIFSCTSAHSLKKLFNQDKDGLSGVSPFIVNTVMDNGFRLNELKVHIANRGSRQLVNGILVNEKTNIRREQYREFRALFHRWKSDGYESAAATYLENNPCYRSKLINSGMICDEDLFQRHIRGRLDYLSMVTEANGRPSEPIAKLWTLFHECTGGRVPYVTYDKAAVQLMWMYDSAEKGEAQCAEASGVIVQGVLITCEHCLPEEDTDAHGVSVDVTVMNAFGKSTFVPRKKFKTYKNFDFAYCLLDRSDTMQGIALYNSAYCVQPGEQVIASGYAEGKAPSYCVWASVRSGCHGNANVVVDRAFIKGMSGGPVFNTRHEAIGIVAKGSDGSSYSRDGEYLPFSVLEEYEPFRSLSISTRYPTN